MGRGGSTTTAPPAAEFDDLMNTVGDASFDVVAPVNIPEAVQFRRMYTVGNYLMARVPAGIAALNTTLTSNNDGNGRGLPLTKKADLLTELGAEIDTILQRVDENTNPERAVLREVRAWFDLGTEPVPNVNTRFKTTFKQFVAICADDLFGVDLEAMEKKSALFDPEKVERLFNLYRDAKRRLIELVESMSDSGTIGSNRLVEKWADIVADSLKVLKNVGKYVATDDSDRQHVWSVLADLVGRPKVELAPHIVHAREGGQLLDDAIKVYQKIQSQPSGLSDETEGFLRKLFTEKGLVFDEDTTVAKRFRERASLVLTNWPANWG